MRTMNIHISRKEDAVQVILSFDDMAAAPKIYTLGRDCDIFRDRATPCLEDILDDVIDTYDVDYITWSGSDWVSHPDTGKMDFGTLINFEDAILNQIPMEDNND